MKRVEPSGGIWAPMVGIDLSFTFEGNKVYYITNQSAPDGTQVTNAD
jgi:hypothetical protein